MALLLSALSLPGFSDELPEWAAAMTETEAKQALVESVERLETTTNELEQSMNRANEWRTWSADAMSLNNELLTARREDVTRFATIETSLIELETAHRSELRRERWSSRLEGLGVGAIIGVLVALLF